MSQPSEDHRFLDGPAFVEWLYEVRPQLDGNVLGLLGETIQRRISDYRHGASPEAFDVPDRICVKLDLHLDDIPDRIWLVRRAKYTRRAAGPSCWEKRKAIEMTEEGYFATEIADQLNVSVRTIQRWRAEHRRLGVAA